MIDMNENDFRIFDQACRETFGKPASQTTIGEIEGLILALTPAHISNATTVTDQVNAVLRDTTECGCAIQVPRTAAGAMDLAGARPLHTCGVTA